MEANFPGVDPFGEDETLLYVSDSLGFAATDPSSRDPSQEDNDFAETAKFIGQILMEENVEQRPFYDSLSLQVTEQSFYDALTGNLPLSPNQHPLVFSPEAETATSSSSSSDNRNNNFSDENSRELKLPSPDSVSVPAFQFNPYAVSQPPPSIAVSDGFSDLDSSIAKLLAQNMFDDADSVSQFRRGMEEASKFLPPGPNLLTGLDSNGEQPINMFGENSYGVKGRKNHEREERDTGEEEEGRSNKQSALALADESDLSDAFDRVLLNVGNVCNEHSRLPSGAAKVEEPDGGKGRTKRQGRKKETVDLRNLLLMCSQSVFANDNRTAYELLRQIRQHSSPSGDASQRLAHYFANGLGARLVGDGTAAQGCFSLLSTKITAAEFLKVYQVFLSASPFKKFTYFFANKMIMKAAAKAETVHVIDFGILYGFQWPILIKFLSNREGGPPKLRITGIEFPQPGFRPTERNEETGRRLANYCKRYNVPFEYNAIASRNWETIQVEALKIQSNELVAVNCHMSMYAAMVKLNLLVKLFQVLVSLVWRATCLTFRCCDEDCTKLLHQVTWYNYGTTFLDTSSLEPN
ncbi:Scarecrow protein 14 [Spatholobus suberectus]|nr:Scarecrow protein 14 [Spatholobus suberectus]